MADRLTDNNLRDVEKMLEDARFDKNDWEKLGREFGLHPNTLRKIKKENDNDDACLSKCLEDWLNRRDDIEKRHGLPTWKSLVKVLKDIGKKNEAEHVETQTSRQRNEENGDEDTHEKPPKTCGTNRYDSTCHPDASDNDHAVRIFNVYNEQLECLNKPDAIAKLLYKEEVLSDHDFKEVSSDVLNCKERLNSLFPKIKLAINEDHKVLLKFARICMNTGNEAIGNNILLDWDAALKQSEANYEGLCEDIGSSIKDIEKKAKESVKYFSKLTLVLKQRFCITLSTVNDCMAVVRRETTMFNTTLLEEVASELECYSTKKKIDSFNSAISTKMLCNVRVRELSYHATVETLSIAMSFDPDRRVADIDHIFSKLFGDLFKDVKWHGNVDEGVVCYFDPLYATLLMDKIIKGFSFCKKNQIQTVTVGYCSVYNEILCDEAYKKLEERIDALEKRNSELKKLNEELDERVKDLTGKIYGLEEVNEDLKKKAISLEDKLKEKEGHIEELQSRLKEKSEMKNKIHRRTMQENEYLKSMLCELRETKNLEAMMNEKENEIEILQEKISLLSCQLHQNESYAQKEINSLKNENKALAKNLELKTALNETTLQQLTEKQAEIGILQEKLSMETGRNIRVGTNNSASKEAPIKEETTDQPTPMPQQQEYDPHTENIFESDSEITLTAPSLKKCKEIPIRQQATLSLNDAFVDSASAILLRLPVTSIKYLHINRTPLSHDSIYSIINLLQRLKALHLTDVAFPSTSLSYILNVLLTNESLEKFTIQFNSQMILPLSSTSSSSYAQAISDVVRSNSTLQYFSALGLRLDEAGVVKILHALKNNTTLRLLTLDQSHQATAYRFSEANGPIKDRLSFS